MVIVFIYCLYLLSLFIGVVLCLCLVEIYCEV